jgi:hypothetical protein
MGDEKCMRNFGSYLKDLKGYERIILSRELFLREDLLS